MNKIKCIIVDDEDPARALLKNYVEKIDYLQLEASCESPIEAFNVLNRQSIDLLFLDIQMPEMKGTDFLASLNPKPLVVFTTAYSEYAIDSYELEAVDYLLKPIRFERFLKAVQKVNKLLEIKKGIAKETLTVKSGYDLHKVNLDDILYIEGMKEYVAFHTSQGRIVGLYSLKSLEEILPAKHFIRVHRSYIVQKKYVKSLSGKVVKIDSVEIPVGESYLEEVRQKLFC